MSFQTFLKCKHIIIINTLKPVVLFFHFPSFFSESWTPRRKYWNSLSMYSGAWQRWVSLHRLWLTINRFNGFILFILIHSYRIIEHSPCPYKGQCNWTLAIDITYVHVMPYITSKPAVSNVIRFRTSRNIVYHYTMLPTQLLKITICERLNIGKSANSQ